MLLSRHRNNFFFGYAYILVFKDMVGVSNLPSHRNFRTLKNYLLIILSTTKGTQNFKNKNLGNATSIENCDTTRTQEMHIRAYLKTKIIQNLRSIEKISYQPRKSYRQKNS